MYMKSDLDNLIEAVRDARQKRDDIAFLLGRMEQMQQTAKELVRAKELELNDARRHLERLQETWKVREQLIANADCLVRDAAQALTTYVKVHSND